MKLLIALLTLIAASSVAFSQNIKTIEGKMQIEKSQFVIVTTKSVTASELGNKVTSNRVMLAGYSPSQVPALRKLEGKNVQATGNIGPAFSPHHTEPLVIVLEGIPKIVKN